MVAEVEDVGNDVTRFQPCQVVTVNPNIYCGACGHCLAGWLVLCVNA